MPAPIKIEILYFDGCPNVASAQELVAEVVREAGVNIQLALIKVESDAQAVERRFVGSPSIRVEGEDVATVENNNQEYSMRCRVYFADSGMTGLPPRSKLLDAIAGALKKAEDK